MSRIITTADCVEVTEGDRVYNYYDGEWGTIGSIDDHANPDVMIGQNSDTPYSEWSDYWFDFTSDDGRRSSLNGSRISMGASAPRGR